MTVKIKPDVKFAPPLNRAVTSADVQYAFERDFNPNVPNGYATSYYTIVGADKSKGGPISGIDTPDKTTIVFHLTSNFGATFAQALSLPGSAPVPKDVAGPMDKSQPDEVRQPRSPSRRSPARTSSAELQAGPQPDAGAQPELEGGHRLPAGLRRQDRLEGAAVTRTCSPARRSAAPTC